MLATAFIDVVDEHDRFLPGGFTTRLGPALGVAVLDFEGVERVETFGGRHLAEVLRGPASRRRSRRAPAGT